MTKIEEFLRTFKDQRLANLQAATEDGQLVYKDSCNCLLHHRLGNYSYTKWSEWCSSLAREAEMEFMFLAPNDPARRELILPMIHAEWTRRTAEREQAARQEALCEC